MFNRYWRVMLDLLCLVLSHIFWKTISRQHIWVTSYISCFNMNCKGVKYFICYKNLSHLHYTKTLHNSSTFSMFISNDIELQNLIFCISKWAGQNEGVGKIGYNRSREHSKAYKLIDDTLKLVFFKNTLNLCYIRMNSANLY